ncbi:hypothetical protein ATI61_118105 [Archangium gephyra]|uniref:Uncharacterized protein n=1 Tax=Archangium gephyra TaxID=48 RepID=A0AAC8TER5_9BACT|nr:hypothetical protein [Archangium gephyra]AKJ03225.1 Hypothetical protein AA314_04851 [Archangium gephyra]REG22900.1 hypothetical protein ATI61_118105 [Archangium gephyra]
MVSLLLLAALVTFAVAFVRVIQQRRAQAAVLLPKTLEQLGYQCAGGFSLSPIQAANAVGIAFDASDWRLSAVRDFHGLPIHFRQGLRRLGEHQAELTAAWSAPLTGSGPGRRHGARGAGRVLERNDPLLDDARIAGLLAALPFGRITLHDDYVEFSDPTLSNLMVGLGGSIGHQLATIEGRLALLASLHERIAELLARLVLRCA